MKRFLAFLLAIFMLFSLCACNDEDYDEEDEDEEINEVEDDKKHSDKKGDNVMFVDSNRSLSKEHVLKSLNTAIATEHPTAKVDDFKVMKSITSDSSYEASLEIYAKTNYSKSVYNTEVEFLKYDQGWILENANWEFVEYTLEKKPSKTEFKEIASSNTSFVERFALEDISDEKIDADILASEETLVYRFNSVEHKLHIDVKNHCVTKWAYNYETDEWKWDEETRVQDIEYDDSHLDFTGTYKTVTIRNFSWEQLEASFYDIENEVHTVTFYADEYSSDELVHTFTDANDEYQFSITYYDEFTLIGIIKDFGWMVEVYVSEGLELSDFESNKGYPEIK